MTYLAPRYVIPALILMAALAVALMYLLAPDAHSVLIDPRYHIKYT